MNTYSEEQLLILTKTYPVPSGNYIEVTCVAALTSQGDFRRLYPIPFRLLDKSSQFKRWEWITARTSRATSDRRPESYRIDIDSIRRGQIVGTSRGWQKRLAFIQPHILSSFAELESRRASLGYSLGILRPTRLIELQVVKSDKPDWDERQKAQLSKQWLFHREDAKQRTLLRKVPYDFYYKYEIESVEGTETLIHKITDWEVGRLYWRCVENYGASRWEAKFRQKIEFDLAKTDLLLLIGTMHRFPDQWLIIGLIYPPKRSSDVGYQLGLDL
jgi:hypothetical protein